MVDIDNMPPGFRLANNTEHIVLVRDDDDSARLVVAGARELKDPKSAVTEHQEEIRHREQGVSVGTGTMWSRFGEAHLSTGRFSDDGLEMEETRVFILRESAVSLMVAYRYRIDASSRDRLEQLRTVVGQL